MFSPLLSATNALCHGEPPLWAHVAYARPIGQHAGRNKLEKMVSQWQHRCNLITVETLVCMDILCSICVAGMYVHVCISVMQ